MDYKEKVIALLNSQELSKEQKEKLEHIFPELKESEDERIRKAIIGFFELQDDNTTYFLVPKKDIIAWLEKQGEQKPADKVEPKFKVGDWITNGDYTWKIVGISPLVYILQSQDGNIVDDTIFYVDKEFNLWTIADAKDGDVLVIQPEKGSESNEQIFLFKAINSRDYVDNCIEFYCRLYNGVFYKNKTGYMGTTLDVFYPATKEQRDLLFQKMEEAGYEWNADKKELKKIEPNKVNANKVVIEWINANKVIEWLKNTIRQKAENYGVYKETRLILPYNSIEDLINDFKKDFGL